MNKFTQTQLEEAKKIGTCMLVTASKSGVPHCTIVEPSRYFEDEIVIPIVQMVFSIKNIEENSNVFIHITKVNEKSYGDSTQYKINATATLEHEGDLFEEVKHFEETERLPEGWKVRGIVRAKISKVNEVVG